MILGVGTDLASVPRLARAWQRQPSRLPLHILAPAERQEFQCLRAPEQTRFLARRWAAKEALVKALGGGFGRGVYARDIAVTHDAVGAPGFRLAAGAASRLRDLGDPRVHLSVTDDGDYALAFVVLETG
ncbi:MAG TPA: holo-[acyl-carrier-protein] synthase [Gammaproteobacteria bacterium]|nr:holo-[acyl-carrier-protein] synthase [Gammaproteobacteria bacterium]